MTRHHMTPDGPVPFTIDEEVEWDTREAEFLAGTLDRLAQSVRYKRDNLLRKSDLSMLEDFPTAFKQEWKTYRKALRDIPEQIGFPETVIWPTPPEEL